MHVMDGYNNLMHAAGKYAGAILRDDMSLLLLKHSESANKSFHAANRSKKRA